MLVALDGNDGNLWKTAREFGIPRATLADWNQFREGLFEQGETLLQQRRLRLWQRMELIVNQIVDSMPKKVEKARLSDSAHALRILLDLSAAVEAKAAAKQAESHDVYEKLAKLMERYKEHPIEAAADEKLSDS